MARKRKPKMTEPVEELFEASEAPAIVTVEIVKDTPSENYLKLEIENIIDKIKNHLEVLKAIKHAAHASPVASRIDALLESIKEKL